ncbi:MAG: alpha/beta fold hydrolase [Deltaproteobacteria bacterium]|nr:MAG: alpha/beta fold hydrolase [Deltaproteobacteria bacterium]
MAEVHRIGFARSASLYVEELGRGHGASVLFGHSLLCDGRMFVDQVNDLAQDHHVLNVDFRGHGRSDAPRRAYSMYDQADDYLRVMDALKVDRASIVGLSMGGMAAMRLAMTHPDRVRSLVLLDTSASREKSAARARFTALATTARLFGPRPWLTRQAAAVMFGATFLREHPEIVAQWEASMQKLDKRAVAHAVQAVVTRDDVTRRLREITAPTLVVVGDEDVATPPVYARTLAAAIPNARLEVVPMTGHLSTVERPRVTGKLIRKFLERHRAG